MCAQSIQLSPVDAAWLHMEDPTNLMMITGVMLLKGRVDFARVRDVYAARLLQFRRFRQRIVEPPASIGLPHWEDDPNFDLNAHIHHIALPEPGGREELIQLLSDMSSTSLDFARPPWQVHVVDNVEGGNSAVIMRLHHCIGDGTALVAVTMQLLDETPDAPLKLPEKKRERRKTGFLDSLGGQASAVWKTTRNVFETLWQESVESIQHPSHLVELAQAAALAAAHGADSVTRALGQGNDPMTPLKGKLGISKRVAWSEPVSLERVKAVGHALDAKVNDVLVAAMTGALRHYLLTRAVPVDDLTVHAVIPVDLRPSERALDLGNVFGLVFLGMPVSIVDPIKRLVEVKKRMDALKNSPDALLYYGLLNVFGMTPKQVEEQVVDFFGAKATAVLTNVMGPRNQLFIAGAPIENIMFWVPQSGRLGMGISIYSYNGKVTMGVITDAGLVPDPHVITDRFSIEFEALVQSVAAVDPALRASTAPLSEPHRCQATTQSGARCRNRALIGSEFCRLHRHA